MKETLRMNVELYRMMFNEIDESSELKETLQLRIVNAIAANVKKLEEIEKAKITESKVKIKELAVNVDQSMQEHGEEFKDIATKLLFDDIKNYLTGQRITGQNVTRFSVLIGKPLK